MGTIKEALEKAMEIDGATGVALVDYTSGMALGMLGGGDLNLELAAAGNTEVVKSKLKVMKNLGLAGTIEDILITLNSQYHLIRLLKDKPNLFLYLVLNKAQSNLALARMKLTEVESEITV